MRGDERHVRVSVSEVDVGTDAEHPVLAGEVLATCEGGGFFQGTHLRGGLLHGFGSVGTVGHGNAGYDLRGGVAHAVEVVGLLVIGFVEGLHITQVETATRGHFHAQTETEAVAATDDVGVLDVVVGSTVVGALPGDAGGEMLADVELFAGSHFPGAVLEEFLGVGVGFGLLVEVAFGTEVHTHPTVGLILQAGGEDSGHVGTHFQTVLILGEGFHALACGAVGGFVLQVEAGAEVIACGEVPLVVNLPVDADDGSNAEAVLAAIHRDVLRSLG